jgi:endo-1,4-beta-xylanase
MKLARVVAIGATAAAVVCTFNPPLVSAANDAYRDAAQPLAQPLRALAARHDLRVGTAVDMAALEADEAYQRSVVTEFSTVTAENAMKWEVVEPQRGSYDWSAADRLVTFARSHGQRVRGHTLLWHSQLPAWLTTGVGDGSIGADELRAILRAHVFAEAGHFKGKIWQWDVLNEAIADDGTMRDTIWLQKLGPGYVADVFRWAHQADPAAKLYYNDYNIEFTGAKGDAALAMVTQLVRDGVPIDGVGFQGHLGLQYGMPSTPELTANLRRFTDLGLDVAFTEVDVRMVLPDDAIKTQAQAQGYSLLLNTCLLLRDCVSFTVWGFTDKYSWIPGWFDGHGAANILDESFQPKPAYRELQTALAIATGPRRRGA